MDDLSSPDPIFHSMTMEALASRVDNLLNLNSDQDELFSNVPKMAGRKVIAALDHFTRSTYYSVGTPTGGKLMREGVMELALSVCWPTPPS